MERDTHDTTFNFLDRVVAVVCCLALTALTPSCLVCGCVLKSPNVTAFGFCAQRADYFQLVLKASLPLSSREVVQDEERELLCSKIKMY